MREAFDEFWKDMKPGRLWRVDSSGGISPGVGGAGGNLNLQFSPAPPSFEQRELAHAYMLALLDKCDSIVCDPEDLAKRAWALADAMDNQVKARTK